MLSFLMCTVKLKSSSFNLPGYVDNYCVKEAKKTDKRKISEDGGKSLGLKPKSPMFSF